MLDDFALVRPSKLSDSNDTETSDYSSKEVIIRRPSMQRHNSQRPITPVSRNAHYVERPKVAPRRQVSVINIMLFMPCELYL